MAGDWIPMRLDLCDDPAVLEMADIIDQPEEYVVGCLHKVWSWASRNCHDGTVTGVTILSLSRAVKLPTAVAAMAKVGWLTEGKGEDGRPFIGFPKWENWLSKSAKARLQNSMNQRNARELKNSQASKEVKERHDSVTDLSLSDRDKTVTTVQKSTEEKKKEVTKVTSCPKPAKADPGPLADHGFILSNGNLWRPTVAKIHEWQATFPIMDLDAQLRLAGQWLKDNPAKRKTEKGMHRFLFAWLERAQNSNKALPLFQPNQAPKRPDPYANCPRYS
jgi:hypothetical protein